VAESADHALQDDGALTGGYERLRSVVLSGGAAGWRLGHGVLRARGMVAWMRTIGEAAPATSAGTGTAGPAPVTPLPAADAEQVVAVLAQMVLPLAA
jgi:hypothetical protein